VNPEQHLKVTASHLGRLAYLYVRQSTLRQVFENTESTKRHPHDFPRLRQDERGVWYYARPMPITARPSWAVKSKESVAVSRPQRSDRQHRSSIDLASI
jgi:hypothetical protein